MEIYGTVYDTEADHLRQVLGIVVSEIGLDTPSLRSIAPVAHVSEATLRKWFGSKQALHGRVFDVLAIRLPKSLRYAVLPDVRGRHPFEHLLPDLRLRSALVELARCNEGMKETLARLEAHERQEIVKDLEQWRSAPPSREWRRDVQDNGTVIIRPPESRDPAEETAPMLDPDADEVRLLHHILVGLWAGLADPTAPVSVERTQELWQLACARLVPEVAQMRTA